MQESISKQLDSHGKPYWIFVDMNAIDYAAQLSAADHHFRSLGRTGVKLGPRAKSSYRRFINYIATQESEVSFIVPYGKHISSPTIVHARQR